MKLRKSNSKYGLATYNLKCPVCGRISKNNKCFADHIFHRNWKDKQHKEFAEYLRKKSREEFLKKAKIICPVCKKRVRRSLGNHFRFSKDDKKHNGYIKKQTKNILILFKKGYSPKDMEGKESIPLNFRWIGRIIIANLGKKETLKISKKILSKKRKDYWRSFSKEERKKKMKPIYEAEWKNLTKEQRKKHPWVIAGRKASLESSLKGSKNQKYAFEILMKRLPDFNWIYNHAIDENWQVDIASLEQKIFIEWDGRHHRIPIHGEGYLNNRKNRDKMKNKIITNNFKGCMIRVKDDGRFDKVFVESKVDTIINLFKENKYTEGKIFYL